MATPLVVGSRYLKHKGTGIVYAYDDVLAQHPECVEFVHAEKVTKKPRIEPTVTAQAANKLPETDPQLLEELSELDDLEDPDPEA